MKKLLILFILIFNSNVAFAEDTAKIYIKAGQTINGAVIDATGYTHGIEMNEPGEAWIKNTQVGNAGTPDFLTADGRHGDGRGIVVTGAGAILHVYDTTSMNNSEDGFRVINGGTLILHNAVARANKKIGFFAGEGGTIQLVDSSAMYNLYGFMATSGFLTAKITRGIFFGNKNQGVQIGEGEKVTMEGSYIYDNNTSKGSTVDDSDGTVIYDYGGMSVSGVKEVRITDTEIYDNHSRGFFANSDSTESDDPVRVHIEGGKITGHGDESVISKGDSVITIISTRLGGKCYEEADAGNDGNVGSITVDGQGVTSGDPCP